MAVPQGRDRVVGRHHLWGLLLAGLLLGPTPGSGAGRESPEARAAAAGIPFHATFSICAIDPETGQSGVAVTTRVPFVGRAVPWVRAGVGAVATQSWTIVEYGRRGLDLLEQGLAPDAVIERLLEDDAGRELRQIGVIDMQGRAASHTGKENGAWAGSRRGKHYTVQANIMVGPQVVEAVANRFESTAGSGMPLAERLILALEAGQAQGGDKRQGRLQSAALRVADPNDPGRGGDHLAVSIDVGEHPSPVEELKRIYATTEQRLGYRSFSDIRGPDVVELKRMLQALGYWRKDDAPIPEAPEFDADRELMRTAPEAFRQALPDYSEKATQFENAYSIYDEETMRAVDAFRADHDLDHEGHPKGLVDEPFVRALKAAYLASRAPAD